jgi:hypothetical protein
VLKRRVAVVAGAFAEPPLQHIGRRLQVDDEIGRRQIGHEQIEEPLIDEQLVVVEVQIRVDLVALEQIIADGELAEKIGLPQRRLLAMSGERVEQLRLESGARPIGVEVREERVFSIVEDYRRIEPRTEPIGECGFADAERTFDGDVPEVQSAGSIAAGPGRRGRLR